MKEKNEIGFEDLLREKLDGFTVELPDDDWDAFEHRMDRHARQNRPRGVWLRRVRRIAVAACVAALVGGLWFFSSPNCGRMIVNTVLISLYSLLWSFPVPIILALALNQLRFHKLKRVVQTVLYAPHFISTMIICGMLRIFLSPSGGLINLLLGTSIDFINESSLFRTIYIASGIWQEAGWGTIIYLATLSSVDTALYEAAKVDGASVFQRILHIDLPALVPMAVLQLILSASNLMNVGFEKIYLLQTDLNKAVSDTIAVYVYEQGILGAEYSYSTAIGLFNTAVNIVLLIVVSRIAKKASDVQFV